MAELLAEYETVFVTPEGTNYLARAVGAEMDDGRWQAWIEFEPTEAGQPLRTSRETTQPTREAAVYWATGLTAIYLEGALDRARTPHLVATPGAAPKPIFDEPRRERVETHVEATGPAPVLDPFSVYEKGESVLTNQLGAMSPWHLVNIARAYGFSDEDVTELSRRSAVELVEMIVSGVRESVRSNQRG
jgi:hypothetical protein